MFRRLAVAGASLAIAFTGMLAPNTAQAACTVNVGTCSGYCTVNAGTCSSSGYCLVNASGTCSSNCTVNAGTCQEHISIKNICDIVDDVCR